MIQWSFFVLQTLSLTHALAEINLDFSSVVTDIGLGCRQVWSVVMAYYLLYSEALAAIQHNASELTKHYYTFCPLLPHSMVASASVPIPFSQAIQSKPQRWISVSRARAHSKEFLQVFQRKILLVDVGTNEARLRNSADPCSLSG